MGIGHPLKSQNVPPRPRRQQFHEKIQIRTLQTLQCRRGNDLSEVEHPLPGQGREAQVRSEAAALLLAQVRQARVRHVLYRLAVVRLRRSHGLPVSHRGLVKCRVYHGRLALGIGELGEDRSVRVDRTLRTLQRRDGGFGRQCLSAAREDGQAEQSQAGLCVQRRRRAEPVALLEEVFEDGAGGDAVLVRRIVEERERYGAGDSCQRQLIQLLVHGQDDLIEEREVGVGTLGGRAEGGRWGRHEFESAHRQLVP
mmetsp:Transcript_178/g.428  ORF Transcript_178/g.428 Transcript_178/m.428 type:complete len:254 (-) Transcript_178:234-995(-)